MDKTVLVESLRLAVPLCIAELQAMTPGDREDHVRWWACDGAQQVAARGDVLQFRTKRSGQAAAVFAAMARGLAAAAYSPGGVTAFGVHWCVNNDACQHAETEAAS